jgi:5-methyltetrahydrofolate--homocysteine methyltransferase
VVGEVATKLFEEGETMLQELISSKQIKARGVAGIFPARKKEERVEILSSDRMEVKIEFNFLRQQRKMGAGIPNLSLSDYIAEESQYPDYLGAFAVSIHGVDEVSDRYKADLDDYKSIMVKVLTDRLAEAFAEYLHAKVRTDQWGYIKEEKLKNSDLIREKYQGIRPAPGYPACPDHTEKGKIWSLLEVEKNTGMMLTESFAMYPASAVSGFYFAHPKSKYFAVGRIENDQLVSYSERKGQLVEDVRKWLRPNL